MTDPVSFRPGDGTAPTAEQYALLTRPFATPPTTPADTWKRPRVLVLAGAAMVAVLAAGITIGTAVQGSGNSTQVLPQATLVPVATSAAPSPSPSLETFSAAPADEPSPADDPSPTSSVVVALDPATSQPTELRGPVILNTEQDVAAIPGGKFFTDTEMVQVPEGKWEISAPKKAKSNCMVVMIDLPYRDVQTSGFESPGHSQVLPLYEGNGIFLDEDCRAKLVLAFND